MRFDPDNKKYFWNEEMVLSEKGKADYEAFSDTFYKTVRKDPIGTYDNANYKQSPAELFKQTNGILNPLKIKYLSTEVVNSFEKSRQCTKNSRIYPIK